MITTQKGDVMLMQIVVNHVSCPDDAESKIHMDIQSDKLHEESAPSNDRLVDALLESVHALTLPVAKIDAILDALEDQKLHWAIKMGDSACDIVENENNDEAVKAAIDAGSAAAEHLRELRGLIQVMLDYRDAAIKAGAR